MEDDELLTPRQAADFLKVTPGALSKWRHQGQGPSFIKLGDPVSGHVRYRRSALEAYVAEMEAARA